MANKHETNPTSGTGTSLIMNLIRNDSAVWLFIIPSAGNSEKSAVVDKWNYPVNRFGLHNDDFHKLIFNKEFHVRESTDGSPCTDLDEESYYEVQLNISNTIHAFSSQNFFCSALVK